MSASMRWQLTSSLLHRLHKGLIYWLPKSRLLLSISSDRIISGLCAMPWQWTYIPWLTSFHQDLFSDSSVPTAWKGLCYHTLIAEIYLNYSSPIKSMVLQGYYNCLCGTLIEAHQYRWYSGACKSVLTPYITIKGVIADLMDMLQDHKFYVDARKYRNMGNSKMMFIAFLGHRMEPLEFTSMITWLCFVVQPSSQRTILSWFQHLSLDMP